MKKTKSRWPKISLTMGIIVIFLSGDKNGIIYQEIAFDHENPDLDDIGQAQIVYWNMQEQSQTMLTKLEKKASFLGGVPETLVVTDLYIRRVA